MTTLDELTQPLIKWSEFPNTIDTSEFNAVWLDYIDAALQAAFLDRSGHFHSREAYFAYKQRLRREFNQRLLQIARAK